jgi:SAM-dependent methyltransferase
MTTAEEHGKLWSRGAKDWSRYMESHFQPLYDLIFDRLALADGVRLLDVGCGPGGAALLAAKRGARVAGMDASPRSIDLARKRVPNGDFKGGDMEQLARPDGSFDIVTSFNSFPFAGNPVGAFMEARRVLVSGGRVGIVVWSPREESQQPRLMAAADRLAPPRPPDPPGPFALSARGKLEATLESAGLRLVDFGEIPIAMKYADAETACRAMMAGSSGSRAVQHSGEERVRRAILDALAEFKLETGAYRTENRFKFVIAE